MLSPSTLHVAEVLPSSIRKEKEVKSIQFREEGIKIVLTCRMLLIYIENLISLHT